MSLTSPFTNWIRNTLNKTVGTTFQFFPLGGGYGYKKETEANILNGGYMQNDVVYSVLTKTALLASTIPYIITKNGEPVKENDPLLLKIQNPNKTQTYEQYIQELFINLNLFGDSYTLKDVESIGFNDMNLVPLPPYRIEAVREDQNTILSEIKGYLFNDIAKQRSYEASDIIHSMLIDPSFEGKQDYNGLSPLQAGSLATRALNNANIAEATIFENGAPQSIIVKKANGLSLTKSDQDKLDQAAKERFGGAHNTGGIRSVTGDATVLKIGSTPKELGTDLAKIQQLRNICNLWGVSSGEFNDPANKTYNNAKEARRALYVDFIIPRLEQIMSEHEKGLFPMFGDGYKFVVDRDKIDVLNPDRSELRKQWFEEHKAGVWTVEEYKEMIQ